MNKNLLIGLFAAVLTAGTSFASNRIVFVDLEDVFDRYYKTVLAKSTIETQQREIEETRQTMVDQMNIISAEVDSLREDARDASLTEDIRGSRRLLYETRLLELREKQKEIEEFVTVRQQQLQQQVSRMSQRIMDEIRQAVVEYARREGLHAVIDKSLRRAAIGVFVYTHPDVDITEKLLHELNSRRPASVDAQLMEIGIRIEE